MISLLEDNVKGSSCHLTLVKDEKAEKKISLTLKEIVRNHRRKRSKHVLKQ